MLSNYGTAENTTVVFDEGYLLLSAKETTHIRRIKGKLGRKIVPSLGNPLAVKINDLLFKNYNKQAYLELSASVISVMHSDGNLSSALTVTKACPVTLLEEDTNLMILFL